MKFTQNDLRAMNKLHRVQLASSLPGAKPTCLVGTCSADGLTNLAPFSTITHLGSSPVLIGMVTRPVSVERHTYQNIVDTGVWTLNHVHAEIVQQAHQCSARYQGSEFDATSLSPHYEEGIDAPFVAESRIRFALTLREVIDISSNDTKLLVGEVTYIELPDEVYQSDGGIDLPSAGSIASTALDTYLETRLVGQYAYAKADD